jgi:4-hydroxymandelate oxidase
VGEIINLADFEERARQTLDPAAWAYLEGGASDEITLRANEEAFRRRRFRPRVLRDVSSCDLSTTLLGQAARMPVGIAPTAHHGLFHPECELGAARAAAAAGVPFTASTNSSLSLEAIAAAGGDRWFQLYAQRDRAVTESLVKRAEASGYRALVVTLDTAGQGRRERDMRMRDVMPQTTQGNDATGGNSLEAVAPFLSWRDIDWLRDLTPLPLVLKGIMTPEDAALAVEHGAAAVWVSNHGGRQLDRSLATIDVLEDVAAAAGGKAEVYVDGGVRRGGDVAVALALGARAVFVGRPVLYALAVGGERGVRDALAVIKAELRNTMALLGIRAIGEIARDCVL